MPQLTLYRARGACSLAPHILLRELSIPFSSTLMNFGPNGVEGADGNLTHAQFLEINPSGFVPALRITNGKDEGESEVITELPAILTYIASLAPDRQDQMLGKDGVERAKVYQWLCWLSGTLHGYGYGMILRPGRFAEDVGLHPQIVESGRRKVEECYARIERDLIGEWAVGEEWTIADVNLYLFWGWGYRNGFEMAGNYPKYGRLAEKVEQMESVRAALEEEHLPLQFP